MVAKRIAVYFVASLFIAVVGPMLGDMLGLCGSCDQLSAQIGALTSNPAVSPLHRQLLSDTTSPIYGRTEVDINRLRLFQDLPGAQFDLYYPAEEGRLPGFRRNYYMDWAGLVMGAIRGPDTLACGGSPGAELVSFAPLDKRYGDRMFSPFDPTLASDIRVQCTSTDTAIATRYSYVDEMTGVTRDPLGVLLRQSVIGWKREYLSRAVFVDNWIVNISDVPIERACIGVSASGMIYNWFTRSLRLERKEWTPGTMCGFLRTTPGIVRSAMDTLNLAWFAENDGDAEWTNGMFGPQNPTAAFGIRILSAPKSSRLSFNWFEWNWGWSPRRYDSGEHSRSADWPNSDRALYSILTNGEIDYDQPMSALNFRADGWYPPSIHATTIAKGYWPAILLSVGPFNDPILPGDSIRFTYAVVMGDDFHTDPNHFANTFNYNNPAPYLNGLNFTNLISAAQWAGWFFDNPGVDTDGDGYSGEFHLVDCVGWECDTVYYSGDGVPDFKGPLPPPPPRDITYETYPTKIIARWTGSASEFARDRHMRRPDWEGYKVYLAVDDTAKGWSLVGSWDREDYVRYSYHEIKGTWNRNSHPHTIAEWRQILSDPEFDPLAHTMPSLTTGYRDIATDTVRTATGTIVDIVTHDRWSYFAPGAANHQNEIHDGSHLTINPVRLVGTVDTLIDDRPVTYGVYEYEIENLSQSKQFWISVTAFDYGDYRNSIDPEESIPGENAVKFLAVSSADVVMDSNLKVNVHPNPYKGEFYDWQGNVATYHSQGYEYSPSGKFDERDRRIWFTNLPDTAVIEIYSLDGDLIRMIYHPDIFLTKYPSVVGWDLISRNTQAVVSGIYIWKVSSRLGNQVGKLVIIK